MKIEMVVTLAWMAGIQFRNDPSGNIHVAWIPPSTLE
jgi:hypothetical protein